MTERRNIKIRQLLYIVKKELMMALFFFIYIA